MKRPSSKEILSLFGATIAAEGVTTAAGAAAGTSLIDAALIAAGANSFDSMLAVVYPDSPLEIDSFDIVGFVPATGEVQLNHAYKGVAAAIPIGVPYKIVSFRFVPAEVAALQADVGDASASALGSLYGILGNPAQTFATRTERIEEAAAVYFDTGGVAGTAYPAGTPQSPVNNLTDLLAICAARNTRKIVLRSDITLNAAVEGYYIIADKLMCIVDINGQDCDHSWFDGVFIVGTQAGTNDILLTNCFIGGLDHFVGNAFGCTVGDAICHNAKFNHCFINEDGGVTVPVGASGVHMAGCYGHMQLVDFKAGDNYIDFYGQLTIDNGCTGGTINLYGDFRLIDNSAGTVVNDYRKLTEARAGNLDNCTYLEQTVPIKMNCEVTITQAGGTVTFIAQGATGASGLISVDDAKVQKVFLLIIGRAVNTFDGDNALDCGTATDNQWQIQMDAAGWVDLTNEEVDGQMLDTDWLCHGKGIIHPFTFMFDVDTEITNIDGKIGVRLENAQAEQDTLIVTCDIYLKVVYKL